MGGVGSQLKNRKNGWKFEILEIFTCIRYWSIDSCNFKNRFKRENFRHFWRFPPNLKHSTKLFLFFRYTVYPRGHVGALFKKIQVEKLFFKIIESPLHIPQKTGILLLISNVKGHQRSNLSQNGRISRNVFNIHKFYYNEKITNITKKVANIMILSPTS